MFGTKATQEIRLREKFGYLIKTTPKFIHTVKEAIKNGSRICPPHYFSWLDDLATILGAVRTRLT